MLLAGPKRVLNMALRASIASRVDSVAVGSPCCCCWCCTALMIRCVCSSEKPCNVQRG